MIDLAETEIRPATIASTVKGLAMMKLRWRAVIIADQAPPTVEALSDSFTMIRC